MDAQVVEKLHFWSRLKGRGGRRIRRAGPIILVAALLLIAVWRDAAILFRHPVAPGWNGYYYVLQIDSLRNQGHFYFSTRTPLVFYGLAGLRALLGDTVLAIKIGSLLIHGLLCVGIFALLVSLTRSFWPGVIGMALAAFAPLHLFMVAEYIKQAGALCLLVWGCWATTRAFQTRNAKWATLSATLLVAAAFSHKSALSSEIPLGRTCVTFSRTHIAGTKVLEASACRDRHVVNMERPTPTVYAVLLGDTGMVKTRI